MVLLSRDPRRIGRPPGAPYPDRVPVRLAGGTPEPLLSRLTAVLGDDKVLSRVSDLVRYASDASPYRYVPQAVVLPADVEDLVALLGFARESGTPLTFRAGGTSLNGQSQTAGVLVDVRAHWSGMTVLDDGRSARIRPGMVLGQANAVLARHGRRLGPDPASASAATIGGVVANNSGGMRSGTHLDSYSTVESMVLVLASGTVIDTEAPDAEELFARAEPALAAGLLELRDALRADPELAERVSRKFRIRNTTGYRLCAFLDADTPLEIFRRLVVGSEGTLAFIAEATFRTLPLPEHTTVSWLHFEDVAAAASAVPLLCDAGATAVELVMARALVVASALMPGTPQEWKQLPPTSAALLVEFSGDTQTLDLVEAHVTRQLSAAGLLRPPAFTRDEEAIELAWTVREGMFGLAGKLRPPGTALITEDVCCSPERVGELARDIMRLQTEHGFTPGAAGHAAFGNLHFMLTPRLDDDDERARYDRFMHELVDLVVGSYDGSLKAEHGTGLNMAPFVESEWGTQATAMMWRVKELADPHDVLGRGVMLNRRGDIHLDRLKSAPPIEEHASMCVECGFCEPVCPSRNVTVTPRQRIVLRREMARQPEGSPVLEALQDEFEYDGLQTCATDGSCGRACPVGIDTGTLVKSLRTRQHSERAEKLALTLAKRWRTVEKLTRAGLSLTDAVSRILDDRPLSAAARAARSAINNDMVPDWPGRMPKPARPLPQTRPDDPVAVYFPACINRIFGLPAGERERLTVPEALVAVSRRAGLPLLIPDDVAGHCCATPWSSKGYREGGSYMAAKTVDALWRWTDGGRLRVVVDASSCTHGLLHEIADHLDDSRRARLREVDVVDSVAWLADTLMPRLTVTHRVGSAAIHPTCAGQRLGLSRTLTDLVGRLADEAVVPDGTSCCGTAGDRGLLHPELVRSALRDEKAALDRRTFDAYLSSNRTCEMGLHQATGHPYESVILLAERLTR